MTKAEGIQEKYRSLIDSGIIAAGERLPSVREESASSGVSVNTVVAAYERLEDEGLIRSRQRGGFFVRPRRRAAAAAPPPPDRFVAEAREAGERLEVIFERLVKRSPSFAVASPGPDLLPSEILGRALGRLPPGWIEYADPAGDAELRRKIALWSGDQGGPTEADDIVVTAGATEALSIVLRTLLKRGDRIAVEAPTYFNFFRQLAPLDVSLVEIPMGKDGMDLDTLEREFSRGGIQAVLVQPNVQNPTGTTMSDEAKSRLASMAEKEGAALIQDDVYGDLFFGASRPKNLDAFGDFPGLVYVSSFSKSVAPGLRVGWIKSRFHAARFAEEKLRSSFETCRASQFALRDFICGASHRRHLKALRAALSSRVEEHIDILDDSLPEGCGVVRPTGGCLLWVSLPSGKDGTEAFRLAARDGLIAAPGEMFSASGFFSGCLRINAGWVLDDDRAAALRALGRTIRDM